MVMVTRVLGVLARTVALGCTISKPYLGVVSLARTQDRRTSDTGGSGGASVGGTHQLSVQSGPGAW